MEGQRPRLPVFVEIHKRGIARQKAEQADKKRREEEDREFWKKKGMVDHQHDLSDEDTDRGDSDSDSDYGGGKKNHTNRKYKIKTRKYTMKTRKNKSKNKKSKKKWSLKYKKSINCKRPRGFSQRQYCKYGRKKS
jgi:hypothetical protein